MSGMTPEITDTGTDTPTDTPRARWPILVAFGAPILTVAGASFAETFHGLFDLMQRVEREGNQLSAVGPVGIDGLQLVALAGTYFLRRAPWHVRLYMWLAFLAANAVSVVGNIIDASARHLTDAGIGLAGVWPILLALASHVAIVAIRQLERSPRDADATTPPKRHTEPVGENQDDEQPNDKPKPDRPASPTDAQLRARARARYTNGASCRQIAEDMRGQGLDVSEKRVERWTADIRRTRKTTPTDEATPEPTSEEVPA